MKSLGDHYTPRYKNRTTNVMIGVLETNWNQIKRELITMWQIVNKVREETTVTV